MDTFLTHAQRLITNELNAYIQDGQGVDAVKVGKQFMHADKRAIPFAIIVGETEMNEDKFALKNLVTGEQVSLNFEELKNELINN